MMLECGHPQASSAHAHSQVGKVGVWCELHVRITAVITQDDGLLENMAAIEQVMEGGVPSKPFWPFPFLLQSAKACLSCADMASEPLAG